MSQSPTFTTPGAEAVAAAYGEMRDLGVSPLVARDWLTEQVSAAARDDIAQQVERNDATPAASEPVTVDKRVRREIDRALHLGVAVYNHQRSRVTALDFLATESGAAAINRAAVVRRLRTSDTDRAVLLEPKIDTIQISNSQLVHYAAAVIRVGPRARAISARFTSDRATAVRLTHFDVLMP